MTDLSVLLPSLVGVFVVATLMESALTTLFQWRLYLEFFNGRAVKTLIMIAVGYAVVSQFSYDIFDNVHERLPSSDCCSSRMAAKADSCLS